MMSVTRCMNTSLCLVLMTPMLVSLPGTIEPVSRGEEGAVKTRLHVPSPAPQAIGDGEQRYPVGLPAIHIEVEMTPELVSTCLAVASDIDHALADRLRSMQQDDPALFQERLAKSQRLLSLASLRLRDPSGYALKRLELTVDASVQSLAHDIMDARQRDRKVEAENLRIQLLGQIRLQIAFSHRAREEQLCQLQDMVERLQSELARERAHLDQRVYEQMRILLGEDDTDSAP